MDRNVGVSLEEAIFAAEKDLIYLNYFDRWQEFKKEWSLQDKKNWDSLLARVRIDEGKKKRLEPPLSSDEKVWAMDLIRRAIEWGLC